MTKTIAPPDLGSHPLQRSMERTMKAPVGALYRAWTSEFDRWFAAPGSALMRAEPNAPFFFETQHQGQRHPHYGRFLQVVPERTVSLTWMSAGTKGAETILTIALEARADGTTLRLVHAGFPDAASLRAHEEAWPLILAHLDETLR